MKYYKLIFFLIQIFFVISPIPTWDFNSQAVNLITSEDDAYYYDIYQKTEDSTTVTLWKKIVRENGMISYNKTYVSVGTQSNEVTFEDIDSHYANQLGCSVVVCPRGKFHPYNFYGGTYITPDDSFEDQNGWDLRCFNHKSGHFLIFYTNNENYNFYSKCASCSTNGIKKFYFGNVVYDYYKL